MVLFMSSTSKIQAAASKGLPLAAAHAKTYARAAPKRGAGCPKAPQLAEFHGAAAIGAEHPIIDLARGMASLSTPRGREGADRAHELRQLSGQLSDRTARVDAHRVERFVLDDVAHAWKHRLIKQRVAHHLVGW